MESPPPDFGLPPVSFKIVSGQGNAREWNTTHTNDDSAVEYFGSIDGTSPGHDGLSMDASHLGNPRGPPRAFTMPMLSSYDQTPDRRRSLTPEGTSKVVESDRPPRVSTRLKISGSDPTPPSQGISESKSEAKAAYCYEPLRGPDYLRILILEPADSLNAPVYCTLETVSLREASEYTALSYSWGMNADGDNTRNSSVLIDGHQMPVTLNLYQGLHRLRHASEQRRLWVDAVCINQNDLAERSDQVSRMAEIFAHAAEVAVWLGENTDGGEDMVQSAILRCFGEEYDHPPGAHTWHSSDNGRLVDLCALRKATSTRSLRTVRRLTVDHSRQDSVVSLESRSSAGTEYDTNSLDHVIRALDSLFNRRYFKRRWILQELYHSPPDRILLYFGSSIVSMDTFAAVCGQSIRSPRSLRRFIVASSRDGAQDWKAVQYGLREVERVLRLAKDKEKTTFLEALERSTHLECSDPRDVLYSLASLDPSFGVVTDYNLSTAEVYTGFARLLVEKGLPSWVPNFNEGFMRSADARESEDSPQESSEVGYDLQAVVTESTLHCSFFAIGTINFGQPWARHNIEHIFESWRNRLQLILGLTALPDVFELSGTRSYDAISMGDIVCSNRRVYTTEEAIIVVLTPADTMAKTFKIVQVHRGNELKSFNGQDISELWHHSALPEESQFRVAVV
ncbi:hypothetical protein LTR09_000797 [Extremus antarcticus]|uniref:Heterokaryon incompatibility domain-containing protein n=1 Tax=Extremus antarcticus TaxID=702011 RepID=A0AAJ0GKG1_9PEZI|nr:hypothetical protein LTR09_000797 [Extremus antarcticus]